MSEASEQEVEEKEKEPFNLLEAMGGGHGIADSSLPGLAFVIAYTASGQDLETAIWAAVALGAVLLVVRLARRETLQFAIAGFVGVAIAAFIAQKTGKAENFFLPGLLLNLGYALAYLISIAVRWPLIGVFIGPLVGEGMEWRKDPRLMTRLYAGELDLGRACSCCALPYSCRSISRRIWSPWAWRRRRWVSRYLR